MGWEGWGGGGVLLQCARMNARRQHLAINLETEGPSL